MEPDPRWRSPGSSNWYSPRYRGGGGGGFRGNNYSPRQNHSNNSWQHNRSQSPYNYRHQGPPYKNFHNSPYTSTPRHQNWRGGGGRQHHRNSFGASPHNNRQFGQDSIESWVSPQMWEDPWKDLLVDLNTESKTKFADTDFSTDSDMKQSSLFPDCSGATSEDTNKFTSDEQKSVPAEDSVETPSATQESADTKPDVSVSGMESETSAEILPIGSTAEVDSTNSEHDVPI